MLFLCGELMKKLFIVQPMRGLTEDEIERLRQQAWDTAEEMTGEHLEVLDTYSRDEAEPLELLGRSIQQMAHADYVIFCPFYGGYRGCRIEQIAAAEYDKKCLYMRGE